MIDKETMEANTKALVDLYWQLENLMIILGRMQNV